VLALNVAAGSDGGNGQGGALYQAAGSLKVTNSAVTGNMTVCGDAPAGLATPGGSGEGVGLT
jgi:hypothetical protein